MVGGALAGPGRLEHQGELLADPLLADDLVEAARPQRRLHGPLVTLRLGCHQRAALGVGELGGLEVGLAGASGPVGGAHALLSERRAARSSAATSGGVTGIGGHRLDRAVGLLRRPAEPDEAVEDLAAPRLRGRDRGGEPGGAGAAGHSDPVLELEDDPLGALLADPRHRGQRLDVLAGDRTAQRIGRQHGQHRLGELGTDTAGRLHQLEDGLLVVVEEAEQRQRLLAHHHAGRQGGGGARRAGWPGCAACSAARGRLRPPPGRRS